MADDAPTVQTRAGSALPSPIAAGPIGAPITGPVASLLAPRDLYRAPGRLITGLQLALMASIAAEAVNLESLISDLDVVRRLESHPQAVTAVELDSIDRRSIVIWLINVGFALVAGGFLIGLTRRLYRNVPALSTYPRRFTEGWAVGAWFVPLLNLVRPKQIVDDIWRATASDQPAWWPPTPRPVSKLVHIWWASLVASYVLGLAAQGSNDSVTVADVRDGIETGLFAAVASISFAVLTMVVGLRLVARDRGRAESVLGVGSPNSISVVPRLVGAMAVGVGAFVAGLIAFAPEAPTGIADDASGVLVGDLLVGDCFDYPPDIDSAAPGDVEIVIGVSIQPCDVPHDAEIIAEVRHPAASDDAYPGRDAVFAVGGRLCLAQFERAIDRPYEESILDIIVLGPADSWSDGDRTIHCAAYRVDERKLTETVRGSGL